MRDGTRSVKSSRSPINVSKDLYNAITTNFRIMKHKKLKNQLKKVNIQYSLFKWRSKNTNQLTKRHRKIQNHAKTVAVSVLKLSNNMTDARSTWWDQAEPWR